MNNGQKDNDALVSATYRDSAQEKTPDKLDEAVLRMAAAAQPSASKSRLPLWMKPVAWAATIGLTLAIVLDVTQVSDTNGLPASAPASAPPAAAIEEAFSTKDADVVQEAEDMARMRDGPNQADELSRSRQAPAVAESAAAFEVDAAKKETTEDGSCSAASREQAESWYRCVVELRDLGQTAEADREMLLLIEKFPEYQP